MKRTINQSDSISLMSISANLSGVLPYSNNPEDFSICQVKYAPTNRLMIFPASKVHNFNTKQLLELISSEVGVNTELELMIIFPQNISLLLEERDCPFSICDSLFFLPISSKDKKELFEYYLSASPKNKNNHSSILIPVINESSNFLYMMPYLSTYNSFHMESIISTMSKIHNCPEDSISVYSKKGQKFNKSTLKIITIKHVLNRSVYISLLTDDHIDEKIQKRVNILNDLKSTEMTFYKQIQGFVDNVAPIFKKTNIITAKELNDFISAVQYIESLQKKIVRDLTELPINYMTLIGGWFKEYAPFLKIYNQYLSFYKSTLPRMTEGMNSKENDAIFEAFLNSDYSKSLRFDSVLILPVQHPPRYKLFLRDLIKATPEAHPDYRDLIDAFDIVEETIQKLDNEVTILQKKQELIMFENMFTGKVDLICPNRNYIGYYNAQYKGESVLLHLFSDELWMSNFCDKKLKRKFVLSLDDTNVFKYANKSAVIRSLGQPFDLIVLFEDQANQKEFLSNFRKAAVTFLKNQRDQIKLRFETVTGQDKKYHLSDHSMAFLSGTFYVFGGRDEKGKATNGFYRFTTENPSFVEMPVNDNYPKPCPRFMAAFCAIDTGVFLYGGTDDEKNGFSDFWFYSFRFERWQELSKQQDPDNDPPPAGFGLELIASKSKGKSDTLILSGGKDEFGIYAYVMKQKIWRFVELKNGINILSLYGHSMIPVSQKPDNFLIIGGKNSDGDYNRFPIYMTKDCESVYPVNLTRIYPINRFQHKSVVLDGTVYIIGGDDDENIPFALHISLSMFTVPSIEGEKNHAVKGFAMATDGKSIYLHGGFDKKGSVLPHLMKIAVNNPELKDEKGMNFVNGLTEISFEKDQLAYSMMSNPKSINDDIWIC